MRQPPEPLGNVGWVRGCLHPVPGGEQKLETGSVCRLHDNKGGGDSITVPSPLLPGLAQDSLLPLLLGLGYCPLVSHSPRIMGFK